MKLALHGYGKMGRAIEAVSKERGHEIAAIYDSAREPELNGAEVMIDFSQAAALDRALDICCGHRIPLVIGTTGWNDRIGEVRSKIERAGIGVVYASNFSPGANITFALARRAGELFARFPHYAAAMEERHHAQKKDAPSGTALRIAEEVKRASGGKLDPPIAATRVGSEFGLHTLFFDSPDDLVEISHRARGREGFARGAVLAAEMIRGRKGLIAFDELVMS
ncbi:MAG TPA: dihydrodipicolinate reductase C-terminal domain-containing protein [Thermoanaerobaculia bacterium]|nr:dihydrodipicolinate reductase C-terminal domain-containing protein [Thermoanaerobaculia bacterium]